MSPLKPTHNAALAAWRVQRLSDPGLKAMREETAAIVRIAAELNANLTRIERRIDGLARRIGAAK